MCLCMWEKCGFLGNVQRSWRENGVRVTEMGRLWEGSDGSLSWSDSW